MLHWRRNVLTFIAVAAAAVAQDQPARLTFDVATIKPSEPGAEGGGIQPLPGGQGYTARATSLRLIMALMYRLPVWRIEGGPVWLGSDLWDIEAKADRPHSIDDLHAMFQNLLADRFGLQFHKDIRRGAVYALTIDGPGIRMKANESPEDYEIPIQLSQEWVATGKRVSMEYLSWWLGQMMPNEQRPVIDMTGLPGNYDFTLRFAPEFPLGVGITDRQSRPGLAYALQDQLGLRLDLQRRGQIEYYVIDSAAKPSGN